MIFTDMTPVKTVGQYCLISQVSLEALPLATHMRIEVILDLVPTLNSYLRDIWEYDAESETWEQLTTCPCSGRRHPAFLVHDSTIYVGLGDDQSGDLNDWWQYNMRNDQWLQLDDLPALARHHPFQFVVDEQIYVGFGATVEQ